MDVTIVAAVLFALAAAVGLAFQVALALGAPWGSYTMGGRFRGRLPRSMRVAAVAQALLIGLMGAIVSSRAGLVLPSWAGAATWLTWAIVAFSGVNLILNAVSPSSDERRVWVPVTVVLLVGSLTVALTAR